MQRTAEDGNAVSWGRGWAGSRAPGYGTSCAVHDLSPVEPSPQGPLWAGCHCLSAYCSRKGPSGPRPCSGERQRGAPQQPAPP